MFTQEIDRQSATLASQLETPNEPETEDVEKQRKSYLEYSLEDRQLYNACLEQLGVTDATLRKSKKTELKALQLSNELLEFAKARKAFAYSGDPFVIRYNEDRSFRIIGEDRCSKCDAKPGFPCVDKEGHALAESHEERSFEVPGDYAEFEAKEPRYIRNWVVKKLRTVTVPDQADDWINSLEMHMRYLPSTSVGRKAGYNGVAFCPECNAVAEFDGTGYHCTACAWDETVSSKSGIGCSDLIQCFNPYGSFGASSNRFHAYVNRVITNRYNTLVVKELNNPTCRKGTVSTISASGEKDEDRYNEATEEYVHANSSILIDGERSRQEKWENSIIIGRFLEYVVSQRPPNKDVLIRTIATIQLSDSMKEARAALKMDMKQFVKVRRQLQTMADEFRSGTARHAVLANCG
jgi:hypothetical protein